MFNDEDLLLKAYDKYERRRGQCEELRTSLEFWKVLDLVDNVSYKPLYSVKITDLAMSDSFDILVDICRDLLGDLLFDNDVQIGGEEGETLVILEYKNNTYRIIIDRDWEGINTRIQKANDSEVLYKVSDENSSCELIETLILTERMVNDYVRYGSKPIEIRSLELILRLFNSYEIIVGGEFNSSEKEVYEYVVRKLIEKDRRGEM